MGNLFRFWVKFNKLGLRHKHLRIVLDSENGKWWENKSSIGSANGSTMSGCVVCPRHETEVCFEMIVT